MEYFDDLELKLNHDDLQEVYLSLDELTKPQYEYLKSLKGFDYFSCGEYESGNYNYFWLSFDNEAGEHKVYLLDEEWELKTLVSFNDLFKEEDDES